MAVISSQLMAQAWPNFVAHVLSMGMMIADTVIAGRFGTADLAGVAIGSSYYVSVMLLLTGTLQAVAPLVAHHVGARQDQAAAATLQQGFWLACFLAGPGLLLLTHPQPLFEWAGVPRDAAERALDYLRAAAWGFPAVLFFRTFAGFSNAIGQPRALMVIGAVVTAAHVPLAWSLTNGVWGLAPMGGTGCGVSTAIVNWLALISGLVYLRVHRAYQRFALFERWRRPSWATQRDLLRLGLPMGLSTFIDVSSFTLIAILAARMGEATVAGHRVIANMTALIYMLPLSLAIATLVHVGQSMGAQDPQRARAVARVGLRLTLSFALAIGVLVWLLREPLIGFYSTDPTVRALALSLVIYLCFYQAFDGLQTVAAYALRGYKVTLLPMVLHTVCFWGVGLAGGYWLSFAAPWRAEQPSVAGFWQACVAATLLAGVLFITLMRRVARAREHDISPGQTAQGIGQG